MGVKARVLWTGATVTKWREGIFLAVFVDQANGPYPLVPAVVA